MKTFMKLGATLLFAVSLAACDKPNPAADLQKLTAFGEKQQQSQVAFQVELQQKLASQDSDQIESALTNFSDKISSIEKELDAIEIKSDEIKTLKAKMKEALVFSKELLADTIKMMQSPSQEAQVSLQEKTQKALNIGLELQQLQDELQKKYPAQK